MLCVSTNDRNKSPEIMQQSRRRGGKSFARCFQFSFCHKTYTALVRNGKMLIHSSRHFLPKKDATISWWSFVSLFFGDNQIKYKSLGCNAHRESLTFDDDRHSSRGFSGCFDKLLNANYMTKLC